MQQRNFTVNYKGGKVESVKDFMKIYDIRYKNSKEKVKINKNILYQTNLLIFKLNQNEQKSSTK